MKNQYRREMNRLEPRREKLDELCEMLEGGTEMKHTRRLSKRAAAAILVCAALMATAAAAAVPRVWDALWEQLGAFAPYAQTIDGAVCRDQGIEVQVLSALSDDLEARFYLAVRDVTGNRLNEHLTLEGQIENGRKKETGDSSAWFSFFSMRNSSFELLSYDPETRTALFSTCIDYWNNKQPTPDARLSLTGMTTKDAEISGTVSCASVTGETLESLPAGESGQMIFESGDYKNFPYTDAFLPSQRVVLAPGQTPMAIEGNEDIRISSMGFASDGCFHVRLEFADGISVLDEEGDSWFLCTLSQTGKTYEEEDAMWERLVPGGVDILFPLYKAEDLEQLQNGLVEFYGNYTRPGLDIEGGWSVEFQMEYHPSVTLDWTGGLAGRQVSRVSLSPLSVTMDSNDTGSFARSTLYAVKRDGSTVAAEPDTGSYETIGGADPVRKAFNTWKFAEPVDPDEVVGLTLMGETIPAARS